MGKKGAGSSWLTAVKRAFRSPTKDTEKKSSSSRSREQLDDDDQEDHEQKKREKRRRWLFRKPTTSSNNYNASLQCEETKVVMMIPSNTSTTSTSTCTPPPANPPVSDAEQRHAIAVAEAAFATAQAAIEIIRLATPPPPSNSYSYSYSYSYSHSHSIRQQHYAAILIQTSFRGYLARRALHALKGIVKLQALVRGHNVRKQAKMTLKCMQALLRVQSRVQDQRARLSYEGSGRKSMFAESNNLWESGYFQQDIRADRKSVSRDGYCIAADDDSDDRSRPPHTLVELEAVLNTRKEAALKREKALSYAFSQQIWRSGGESSDREEIKEQEERANWLERWMATKQWECSSSRVSTDRRETIKTVEIDTLRPHSNYSIPNNARKSQSLNPHQKLWSIPSPSHHRASHRQSPVTPTPSKPKPLRVQSASPRCLKEDRSYSTANTPSLGSALCFNGAGTTGNAGSATMPNYMAATESAKARVRSQSAPRQRPSTPERERGGGSAKKRLSYHPVLDPYNNNSFRQKLRSPSFKSLQAGYIGMEQQLNLSSCFMDSISGDISPCSTTDLKRWLR